jgi:hypothetical protein
MQTCKAERLSRERRSTLRRRVEMVSILVGKYINENPAQIVPGVADICSMSEDLRDLILESDPAVTVDESSFTEWLLELPEICREWRRSKDTFLVGSLTASTPGSCPASTADEPDVSQLQLATTYFYCQTCQGPILYPRILAHSCLMKPGPLEGHSTLQELWTAARRRPCNFTFDEIRFHREWFEAARQIVLACGQDPAVTTASLMDDLDARFECRFCYRLAMTWRAAVRTSFSEPFYKLISTHLL